MKQEDCPFCANDSFMEGQLSVARYDKFPVSPGHALIVPKRHVSTWFDMTQLEQADAMRLLMAVKDYLDAMFTPQGYNVGINCGSAAGQTIDHAHMHVIPRYKDDVNDPRGGIRGVIPAKKNYP